MIKQVNQKVSEKQKGIDTKIKDEPLGENYG